MPLIYPMVIAALQLRLIGVPYERQSLDTVFAFQGHEQQSLDIKEKDIYRRAQRLLELKIGRRGQR
jgi:hypothetical protein